MYRGLSVFFIVFFCMTLSGCAAVKYLSGSSDEDAVKFGVSKDELWNETKMLKEYNAACRVTIQEKKGEIDQLTRQVTDLNKEIADLKTEVEQSKVTAKKGIAIEDGEDKSLPDRVSPLNEKTITVEDEKSERSGSKKEGVKQDLKMDVDKKYTPQTKATQKAMETKVPKVKVLNEDARRSSARAIAEKLKKLERKKKAVQATAVEKEIETKGLRIKVLSGNGKISSAKAMSEKLKKLGYKIENMGLAPRSNFDVVTIYFARNYRSEAQQMAKQLRGDATVKPLTWSSDFHLIVVTGY
jgi:hypothetical protein